MKTTTQDISGSWHVRTANGRLPAVREVKRPHGEASHYNAAIGAGDPLCGPLVCKLDFGYGYAGMADMARVAQLIAAAPEMVATLRTFVAIPLTCLDAGRYAVPHEAMQLTVNAARALLRRIDGDKE